MSTQKEVFDVVAGERRFQDLHAKQIKNETINPISGEVLVVEYLLDRVREVYSKADLHQDTAALDLMRQIAAVSVRCMERHGVIERVW